MNSYRAILFLVMVVAVLSVLGITSERLTAKLAWTGAALLAAVVGLWGFYGS